MLRVQQIGNIVYFLFEDIFLVWTPKVVRHLYKSTLFKFGRFTRKIADHHIFTQAVVCLYEAELEATDYKRP